MYKLRSKSCLNANQICKTKELQATNTVHESYVQIVNQSENEIYKLQILAFSRA
uniref:Uncharacterized protein n=1 Tax=Anguilla anguilla TaxID=7936 RepID=A0A0E9WMD6_ANGAN